MRQYASAASSSISSAERWTYGCSVLGTGTHHLAIRATVELH
jgi:hypothetical protein